MATETSETAQGRTGTLVVVVGLPDHALTLNRVRGHPGKRLRLIGEHKAEAHMIGQATIPAGCRPWFPAGVNVVAWCAVERRKRGKVWDLGGLVEALKPAFDGLTGLAYADDRQIVGVVVEWDSKPLGTGIVRVTFAPAPK